MNENIDKFAKEILARTPADKQSVRTTFRISEEATQHIAWLGDHLGETAKDLFDALCLLLNTVEEVQMLQNLVDVKTPVHSVRKTYVISAGALKTLKSMASKYKISRDTLVESSVRAFKVLIDKQTEERQAKYKRALQIVSNCVDDLEQAYQELASFLDEGDDTLEGISIPTTMLINVMRAIENALEYRTSVEI